LLGVLNVGHRPSSGERILLGSHSPPLVAFSVLQVGLLSIWSYFLLGSAKEIELVDEVSPAILSESIVDGYHTQSMCSHALFLIVG
jgi:hypothetical protein